jgi:uncharacterized protein (TIGR03083 family)
MIVTEEQWRLARAAVQDQGAKFTALVEATNAPDQLATLDWSIAETAAHVYAVTRLYTYLLAPQTATFPFPDLQQMLWTANVDTISSFNERVLEQLPERDPVKLAAQIQADVEEILTVSASLDPASALPWIGDAQVPVAGMLAHLLNELLLHGYDIAGATGAPWQIPPEQAALFFELFLVGVARFGSGRLLEHGQPPPRRPVAVRFSSAYTTPTTLVAHPDGKVTVADPGDDDVRLTFFPPGLNLMMFGRISKLRAVLTRQVTVSGPRPWLLPAFLRTMHVPGRLPRNQR